MPNSLNVDPGLLAAAAALADTESQTVFARHSAADDAVDSALPGWVGSSQSALAALAGRWSGTTTDLTVRLYRHSEALRVSSWTFAEMDAEHARMLSGVHPGGT